VRAKYPYLAPNEVIDRLTSTATDIGPPGRDDECGFGILNVVKALTAPLEAASAPPTADPAPDSTPTTSTTGRTTAPEAQTQPASANFPAIIGGIVGVLAAAGLVAFLVVRRRKHTPTR
jgi:hypothetical protein